MACHSRTTIRIADGSSGQAVLRVAGSRASQLPSALKFLVAIVAPFVLLSGCVSTTAKKPTLTEVQADPSIVSVVEKYFRGSQDALFDPGNMFTPTTEDDGLRTFDRWWCADDTASMRELQLLVQAHCESRGGSWGRNPKQLGWCTDERGEIALYRAAVGRDRNSPNSTPCSGDRGLSNRTDIAAFVVEAIGGEALRPEVAWIFRP